MDNLSYLSSTTLDPFSLRSNPSNSGNIKPMDSISNGIDPNTIYNNIRDQFYVQVPVEIDPITISEAVEAFFAFLKESDEIKLKIKDKIAPEHRRGDLGLVHRNPEESGYGDKKDFFHYHPHLVDKFKSFIEGHAVVNSFISKADKIWHLAASTVKNILLSLETYYPGIYNKVFETKEPHLVLRFLSYEWDNTQEVLAKPHFDAGSFTLAIAESGPGLRIGSNPDNLKAITHQEGKAVFFLGYNFKNLIPSSELLPGWHDVFMVNKENVGESHVRSAIVMFIDAHDVEAPSRGDLHPWSTEGKPLDIRNRA